MRLLPKLAALAWVAAASAHADDAIRPGVDYHSFANVAEFRVKHVALDLDVSFTKKELSGHVDLTVVRESLNPGTLVLDTRDLDIRSVSLLPRNGGAPTPLTFKIGDEQKYLGRPLRIEMPGVGAVAGSLEAAKQSIIRMRRRGGHPGECRQLR